MNCSPPFKFSQTLKNRQATRLLRWCVVGCWVWMIFGHRAWALGPPQGPVVLEVSGLIDRTNQGKRALLDMAMLQALPQKSFTTQTPWEQKPVTFTGPWLRDVLQLVQSRGQHIRAVALNDYRVRLPVSDAIEHDVVLALQMNGLMIPVRTKGPLFIIYPFDAKKQLQHKTYYERSIWQLKAIEVE